MITTDSKILHALGRKFGEPGAPKIRLDQTDEGAWCWVVLSREFGECWVPQELRPSWKLYAHRQHPLPRGRRRAAEPSVRLTLSLPTSVADRVPTPRQAWIRRVIEDRLMCQQEKDIVQPTEAKI